MPNIGDISRRDKEGLRGRGRVVWAACPECAVERWVPAKRAEISCRSCTAKRAVHLESFQRGTHRVECVCQRCRTTRGELVRENNPAWNGGRTVRSGYGAVKVEADDPMAVMADTYGYVLEHRLVMARYLGRPLTKQETVHHRNGHKTDNRIQNLELWVGNHGSGQRAHEHHCPGCRCFDNEEPVSHERNRSP